MRVITMRDAQQAAFGFMVQQASYIEPVALNVLYPDVQYPFLIPVDTGADQWTKSITYFSLDQTGRADWLHHTASDVPLADLVREKFETGVEMAGIGYRYTLEELAQAMRMGINLTPEKAQAARRASEEFIDDVAIRGAADKGWEGLINNSTVTTVLAPASGNNNESAWSEKSAEQVSTDFNGALSGIYTSTLTVEMADTVLLPIEAVNSLAMRQLPNTTMSLLQWLKENNVYTQITGNPLTIRGVRGLERAGAGDTGRMVVYRRDPAVLKLHMPMPHQFLEVWRRGAIVYDVPGIFRLGGLEIRRPQSIRYVDGISATPYV